MPADPSEAFPTHASPTPSAMNPAAAPDPLLAFLPTHEDAARPWLVAYAPGERVEFTGHVLAMWWAKIAGFLTAEAGPAPQVEVAVRAGWRMLTWCLGAWAAGGSAAFRPGNPPLSAMISDAGARLGGPAGLPAGAAEVCVAQRPEELTGAEIEVLIPRASLAVRWDGGEAPGTGRPAEAELPALVMDGVADVMPYPDAFTAAATEGGGLALTEGDVALTRAELAGLVRDLAGAAPGGAHQAVLVRATGAAAVVEVLAAWAAGCCAILVDPACDEATVALARSQEGALEAADQ